ncbi:MAG: hypothetical protein FJ004_09450, partial [Chloroflexi bacterium]|nr:hypothetical protein [Chloroflexota bacterium]
MRFAAIRDNIADMGVGGMLQESVRTSEPKAPSERFQRIKKELLSTPVHLCTERAVIVTDYFKHHDKRSEPMPIRRAKALRHLLQHKSVKIYPNELIVATWAVT